MEIFKLDTAYDEQYNSPWDAVWYDGVDEDIDVLSCQMRLAPIWKPPQVRVEKRYQTPDIFVFQLYFAVSERTKSLLVPLVKDTVEFLPLSTGSDSPLFALHCLVRVDLDDRAVVEKNSVSANITAIRKYSFDPRELKEVMHVFQVRQAVGSSARDAGYACWPVLVSPEFRTLCQKNGLRGIVFERVF